MQIDFKGMMNFRMIDIKQKNNIRETEANPNKKTDLPVNKRKRRKKRNIKEIGPNQIKEKKKKKNIKNIDIKDPEAKAE